MIDLVLGSLQLGKDGPGGGDEFVIEALADDASWDSPKPVEVTVNTLLQNSSMVITERYDNREAFLRVTIKAPDSMVLAEGEAALFAELGKRNTLTWTPPDGYGPPTVFRVITSSMDHAFDDLAEVKLLERTYGIRLVCEAFARSDFEVTTEAEFQPTDGGDPVTPIDTEIDDCSSATGWSAVWSGSTVVVGSGTLRDSTDVNYPRLRRTGTVDMSATPILAADLKVSNGGGAPFVSFNGDRGSNSPIAQGPSPYSSQGYTRYYYDCPYATVTSIEFGYMFPGEKVGRLFANSLRKQNTPPISGTLRQKFMTVDVPGSAPSDGTLEVYHDSSPLGTVILYTWPEDGQGFAPPLSPLLLTSGLPTGDATLVSGVSHDLADTACVYEIPADKVVRGTYELGAWLKSNATGPRTITWSAQTFIYGTGRDQVSGSASVNFASTGTWDYYPLARLPLPTNRVMPGTDAVIHVTLDSPDSSGIDVDEAYLFDIDNGDLTVVAAGSSRHLWVNAATLDWPMPSILRGTAADGTDAFSTGSTVRAWGSHRAAPPSINVLCVTRTAEDAGVRHRCVPAWHTHAAMERPA